MSALLKTQFDTARNYIFITAAWMAVAGVFSIAILGNAVHNILLGLPVLLLLLTREIYQLPTIFKENKTALLGLLVFALLAISISWAQSESKYSIKILSKYRELILIPFLMVIFTTQKYRSAAILALYIGLILALFASYMIHFNLVNWTSNANSLGNRIFHGIMMSFLAYMTLIFISYNNKYKYILATIFVLTTYNLFFIENGRTGYLLFLSLCLLFTLQVTHIKKFIPLLLITISALLVAAYFGVLPERLAATVNDTLTNSNNLNLQEIDIRFEFYILGGMLFVSNWINGIGIGDLPASYEALHASMQTFWPTTVNLHNEYLQIAVHTGVIGLVLFLAFVISLGISPAKTPQNQRRFRQAVMVTVAISCLFNSSIMDHGDGTLFMVLIALFCGTQWATDTNNLKNND